VSERTKFSFSIVYWFEAKVTSFLFHSYLVIGIIEENSNAGIKGFLDIFLANYRQ